MTSRSNHVPDWVRVHQFPAELLAGVHSTIRGFTASPQPTRVPDTEIQFEAVNSSNVVDWYWLFDSINGLGTSDMPHPDFTFPIDVGGDYPVTLVVTDENGCSSQIYPHH